MSAATRGSATEVEQPTGPGRLLDAAIAVLQREGPGALTMRAVAEQANCSTTGIYTHFGGKSGLVEAIYLGGWDALDDSLAPAVATGDPVHLAVAYRRWAVANPTRYLIMFGRTVPDYRPSQPALDRATRSAETLRQLLADRGVDDPAAAAFHLHAAMHGHVMLELVGVSPVDADDYEEWFEAGMHLTVNGLGCEPT